MKSICVYCGSSPGSSTSYAEGARALGKSMALQGIRLVYGGASVGVMGAIADEVLLNHGEAVGVIPDALVKKEVAHHGLTHLHVTNSMHERKMMMANLSDGFIALPGGIGTLEELSEIWTWAQLGFHKKPFGILNINDYFKHLIAFIEHATGQGFIRRAHRDMLIVETDPGVLIDRMNNYSAPPDTIKWIDRI